MTLDHKTPSRLCADTRAQLGDFVDGECDAAAESEIRDHLETCADCQAEAVELAGLRDLLQRELADEAVPADLWGKVSQRLDQDTIEPEIATVGRRRPRPALRAVFMAMAAVLLLFVATRMLPPGGDVVIREPVNDLITYRLSGRAPDLIASDPLALAGWTAGKIPFELPALKPHLAGHALAGVRLCWLLDRRLVAVSYGPGAAGPMLYVMESEGIDLPDSDLSVIPGLEVSRHEFKGHGVLVWQREGLVYVLVLPEAPDVNALPELLALGPPGSGPPLTRL